MAKPLGREVAVAGRFIVAQNPAGRAHREAPARPPSERGKSGPAPVEHRPADEPSEVPAPRSANPAAEPDLGVRSERRHLDAREHHQHRLVKPGPPGVAPDRDPRSEPGRARDGAGEQRMGLGQDAGFGSNPHRTDVAGQAEPRSNRKPEAHPSGSRRPGRGRQFGPPLRGERGGLDRSNPTASGGPDHERSVLVAIPAARHRRVEPGSKFGPDPAKLLGGVRVGRVGRQGPVERLPRLTRAARPAEHLRQTGPGFPVLGNPGRDPPPEPFASSQVAAPGGDHGDPLLGLQSLPAGGNRRVLALGSGQLTGPGEGPRPRQLGFHVLGLLGQPPLVTAQRGREAAGPGQSLGRA